MFFRNMRNWYSDKTDEWILLNENVPDPIRRGFWEIDRYVIGIFNFLISIEERNEYE